MIVRTSTVLAVFLAAVAPYVAVGSPVGPPSLDADAAAAATAGRGPKCPAPNKCYRDAVSPPCQAGKLCSMVMRPVVVCAWNCGVDRLPKECTQRCKPCKAEICTDICECEILCPVNGPCKA
ncbi:hypothetical protein LPJ73_000514 [Coemansia sp. RSA 2703]|nr:hypothetical protein LPJ73_000514 [Coemansia sp. RSA 2703]